MELYCRAVYYMPFLFVDLQDPPELVQTMYDKLKEGYEVVYAKRRSRKGETLIKRFIAYFGYQSH